MKRAISALIIIVVSCCINIAYAAGPDDFVIIQTKAFLDDYGIHDKGYGIRPYSPRHLQNQQRERLW